MDDDLVSCKCIIKWTMLSIKDSHHTHSSHREEQHWPLALSMWVIPFMLYFWSWLWLIQSFQGLSFFQEPPSHLPAAVILSLWPEDFLGITRSLSLLPSHFFFFFFLSLHDFIRITYSKASKRICGGAVLSLLALQAAVCWPLYFKMFLFCERDHNLGEAQNCRRTLSQRF